MAPALTEVYTEEKTKQNKTTKIVSSFLANRECIFLLCNRECIFLSSMTKLEVPNCTQEAINKDVPSALPKQLLRCERKLLQAEAMDSSAETSVLIIRSSTLAISAAGQREGGGKRKKVDCEVTHNNQKGMRICIWRHTFVNHST